MAQFIADQREIDFILYELFSADQTAGQGQFSDFSKKSFDMIIKEARKLALKEILPTLAAGDKEGVSFDGGQVSVPHCFHQARKAVLAAGLTSMIEDPEKGGRVCPFRFPWPSWITWSGPIMP